MNKSSMGARSMGLSAGSTPYNASSTLLCIGFHRLEEKTDKSQQIESLSQSRVQSRAQKPGVKWCRDFISSDYQVITDAQAQSEN